jgi:hypothetical protein
MPSFTVSGSPRIGAMVRQSFTAMTPAEIAGPGPSHGLWDFLSRFNLNMAGFVIVAMFVVTWLAAMLIWRYGRIEEKWTARLRPGTPGGMTREPRAAEAGEPLVICSVYNNPGGA